LAETIKTTVFLDAVLCSLVIHWHQMPEDKNFLI